MTTKQVMEAISPSFLSEDLSVCTLGRTAEAVYEYLRPNQSLFLDCMGSVIGVAVGVAMGVDSTVYAFESDGSVMYSLSIMETIKKYEKKISNLKILIFNNKILESGGGWESGSNNISWKLFFQSFGINCSIIDEVDSLKSWLKKDGEFSIALLNINNDNEVITCKKDIDGIESRYLFKRFINENLKKGIVNPCVKN